uniref:Secreted protein n=1 Tax=Octopus bimaculoides TaxID=37653 RepID=A0A0L8HZE1_OCTBM
MNSYQVSFVWLLICQAIQCKYHVIFKGRKYQCKSLELFSRNYFSSSLRTMNCSSVCSDVNLCSYLYSLMDLKKKN